MYGGFRRGRGGLPQCGYMARTPATTGFTMGSAPLTREEELNYLKNQAQAIDDDLERINSRVRELESRNSAGKKC
jgi:hypothetical protein